MPDSTDPREEVAQKEHGRTPPVQDIYARLAIVRLAGDLDAVSCSDLKSALAAYLAEGQRYLVLNLKGLSFIDSGGLGTIIWALHRVREQKGSLSLVCPAGPVRESFKITRLDRILEIYPTEDDAVRALVASRQ